MVWRVTIQRAAFCLIRESCHYHQAFSGGTTSHGNCTRENTRIEICLEIKASLFRRLLSDLLSVTADEEARTYGRGSTSSISSNLRSWKIRESSVFQPRLDEGNVIQERQQSFQTESTSKSTELVLQNINYLLEILIFWPLKSCIPAVRRLGRLHLRMI